MLPLAVFSSLLLFASAIRFHELFSNGERHFHGIPVEKYVSSMNRIMEISQRLLDLNATSRVKFEEIEWKSNETGPEYNPFLYQGDVILSERQLDGLVEDYEVQLAEKEGRPTPARLFSIGINRWTDFPITWSIDWYDPPAGGPALIREAFAIWENETCVSFKETGSGRITVRNGGDGCNAHLGFYANKASQEINLGDGCALVGIAAHEIGHSLGLMHTQTRPDRDDYVRIDTSILVNGTKSNYDIPPASDKASTLGFGYDFGSVMHYNRFGFSTIPGRDSLVPLDNLYFNTPGQRVRPSFLDVKEINAIYCADVCSEQLECQNGGYTDPKDCSKCRCPEGLGGVLCDTVAESVRKCGASERVAGSGYSSTLSMQGEGTCYWRISAAQPAANITISVDFLEISSDTRGTCQESFVEIKHDGDLATTGPRFCGYRSQATLIPASKLSANVYIIYKSASPSYKFALRYTAAVSGEEELTFPPPTEAAAPSQWSRCSQQCGGCGTRSRYGIDGRIEHEYCNLQPCYSPFYQLQPFCCTPFMYSPYYPSACLSAYGKR